MKFDVIGRINNMRLPDGKTAILYSVYEAVSNSIHAINDRFSEKIAASIPLARNPKLSKSGEQSPLKQTDIPKRLNSDYFHIGQPRFCSREAPLWVFCFADFKS
jgi:hypothetical protein